MCISGDHLRDLADTVAVDLLQPTWCQNGRVCCVIPHNGVALSGICRVMRGTFCAPRTDRILVINETIDAQLYNGSKAGQGLCSHVNV